MGITYSVELRKVKRAKKVDGFSWIRKKKFVFKKCSPRLRYKLNRRTSVRSKTARSLDTR